MNSQKSGIKIVIDTSSLDKVANKANAADKSLDGVADSANRAERAISGIGAANVDVNVDDSKIRAAQTEIDNLSQTEDIDLRVDTGNAESAIEQIQNDLEFIKKLAVIDIVLQGAGLLANAQDLPFVSSIIEVDNALARLQGTTGEMIPEAEHLIQDLYTQAWGESREAIAGVIIEAKNLQVANEDLEQAVTTAFQVADTGIGDTTEILRTMDSLVKNNLAGSFKEAGDLIVAGFQNGGDRGKDLLDTLNEYGSTFDQLKISGPGALALITSGLKAGVDNSDRIADAMRETGIRLREIGTDENIAAAFSRLDELSDVDLTASLDAYNAGEISGDEFFAGFFDSLAQATESSPAEAATIAATLVGTISEDFGPEAIAQLSPAWDETMGVLEGRAETASNTINNTLTTALTTLARTIETEVAGLLNDTFDIDGIVEKVKKAVPEIATAIREGASISQALEEGLGLEGDPLQRLESAFNNIAIGFMQAIQSVLAALGKTNEADSLASEIARISTGQFDFDLRLTNDGAGLRDSIQTAIDRGVDPAMITDRLQNAAEDMLARGDLSGANSLIEQLKEQATIPIVYRGVEYAPGTTPEEIQKRNPSLFDQEQINAEIAKLFSAQNVDTTMLEENAQILADMYTDKLTAAIAAGDYSQSTLDLAEQVGTPEQITAIQALADMQSQLATETETVAAANESAATRTSTALETTAQSIEDYSGRSETELAANVDVWANWESPVVKTIANVDTKVTNLANKIGSLNTALGGLGEAAVPEEPSAAPFASGGTAYGRSLVGEEGPEVVDFPNRAGIINAANSSVLMRAIDSFAASRGVGGGGSTTNIYLNSTMNAQSVSQADAFGYRLSRQVRGFSS